MPKSVNNLGELASLLELGTSRRRTGMGRWYEGSSKSHMILRVYTEQTDVHGRVRLGQLTMVDTACSSRLTGVPASDARVAEARSVNKALSSLCDVLSALTQQRAHVPYRNHKLTLLLQDCLVKHAQVVMLCTAR